jgi:hypothetical protein
MLGRLLAILGVFCPLIIGITGCVRVPSHESLAPVHVGDVVKRIKCEVAQSVFKLARYETSDGNTPLLFLEDWAAKIHLTLIVDDIAAVTPGLTYSDPLDKTLATRFFPATTELFSLGAGVGLSTEAVRQEDIEFLFSFSDLKKEFQNSDRKLYAYDNCSYSDGVLLESNLDLDPMIESALEPIKQGILKPGKNVGPGAAPAATPPKQTNISKELQGLQIATQNLPSSNASLDEITQNVENKSELGKILGQFNVTSQDKAKSFQEFQSEGGEPAQVSEAKKLTSSVAYAERVEKRVQAVINNVVKPLYSIGQATIEAACLKKITEDQYDAITYAGTVSLKVVDIYNAAENKNQTKVDNLIKDLKDAAQNVVTHARSMTEGIDRCAVSSPIKPKGPSSYDPIDVISETVNFFVTYSGSITPGWKLVQVTAPLAPTLFSTSRKDTNTLILAMGRPNSAADGGIAATPAMNNQILAAILSQAVANQRLGQ